MKNQITILLCFVFLCGSCSQIEFVLKNQNTKTAINNLVEYSVEGDEKGYLSDALIEGFGYIRNEADQNFLLNVALKEEKLKTSIGTNQVTHSTKYDINLVYELVSIKKDCEKIVKEYNFSFVHYPKAEGSNFGSDQALEDIYKNNIKNNVFKFKNFIESNGLLISCLNED